MYAVDPEHPPKPCDHFDLIGGSGTGGLIAILLGRLRLTISECIEAYSVLSEEVFRSKHSIEASFLKLPWRSSRKARFSSTALERVMREIIVKALRKETSNEFKSDEVLAKSLLKDAESTCRV